MFIEIIIAIIIGVTAGIITGGIPGLCLKDMLVSEKVVRERHSKDMDETPLLMQLLLHYQNESYKIWI